MQLFFHYSSAGRIWRTWKTAEKYQAIYTKQYKRVKRKTNYTRAELYCVRRNSCQHSVFIVSTLLSDFLFTSTNHVLRRFSFRHLQYFFDIQFMTLFCSKYSASIMARLITSVRKNSPTTTNLENSEIESISLAVNLLRLVSLKSVFYNDGSAMLREGAPLKHENLKTQ